MGLELQGMQLVHQGNQAGMAVQHLENLQLGAVSFPGKVQNHQLGQLELEPSKEIRH